MKKFRIPSRTLWMYCNNNNNNNNNNIIYYISYIYICIMLVKVYISSVYI